MTKTLILDLVWTLQIFFHILLVVRKSSKLSSYGISGKNNEPNMKKWQNNSFWSQFWPVLTQICSQKFFLRVLPLLDVKHCCKLSMYAISRKTNKSNLKIWQQTLALGLILAPLAQIWAPKFYLWILP